MREAIITIPDQLGSLLRSARLGRGLTQAQLAKRLGLTAQAFSKLEQNAARASFDRVHRVCVLLEMDLVLRSKGERKPPDAGAW